MRFLQYVGCFEPERLNSIRVDAYASLNWSISWPLITTSLLLVWQITLKVKLDSTQVGVFVKFHFITQHHSSNLELYTVTLTVKVTETFKNPNVQFLHNLVTWSTQCFHSLEGSGRFSNLRSIHLCQRAPYGWLRGGGACGLTSSRLWGSLFPSLTTVLLWSTRASQGPCCPCQWQLFSFKGPQACYWWTFMLQHGAADAIGVISSVYVCFCSFAYLCVCVWV